MKTSPFGRYLSLLALVIFAVYFAFQIYTPTVATAQTIKSAKTKAELGLVPLAFEANQGQAAKPVKFVSRGAGYNLLLTANEAILSLSNSGDQQESATVRMSLLAANKNPTVSGTDELLSKTNYFIGNDPQRWQRNISNYAKVKYDAVYPGIDLVYYGNQHQLEYDFIVQPGADPKKIQLSLNGANETWLDALGDLVLVTKAGEVRQRKPVMYQEINGERKTVTGSYILKNNRLSFAVGAYDSHFALVIDPIISYASLLNDASSHAGSALAIDAQGFAYISGTTASSDYAVTTGALNQGAGSNNMAFVTKLSQDGAWPVYTAVFGGTTGQSNPDSLFNSGIGIAVDAQGNAFVTGTTNADNFPTSVNAYKKIKAADADVYVLKLNPTGSAILFSTLLGGGNSDTARAIVIDSAGNPCLTGTTDSTDFPNTDLRYKKATNSQQAVFLARLKADGSALLHANLLDSAGVNSSAGIALDANNNLYVAGTTFDGKEVSKPTLGARFPRTTGAYTYGFQPISPFGEAQGGMQSGVFVAKIGANGKLEYSTVIGQGQAKGIAADRDGNVFVIGSSNFVVSLGQFGSSGFKFEQVFPITTSTVTTNDTPLYGPERGPMFLLELTPAGDKLLISHSFGSGSQAANAVVLDKENNIHITGEARGGGLFPTGGGGALPLENLSNLYNYYPGYSFAYHVVFDPDGQSLIQADFLRSAIGKSIAVDTAGNAYLLGLAGAGFSPTENAFQTVIPPVSQPQTPFIAKFGDALIPGVVLTKSTAIISGRVIDQKGDGVAGAIIKVTSDRISNPFTQIADKDGKYSFANLPKGLNYEIDARKFGFEIVSSQASSWYGVSLRLVNADQEINFKTLREPNIAVVNAANYQSSIAPGSIASAFGSRLAPLVKTASAKPLPLVLAFVSVTITDTKNNQKQAPLFYVSPTQLNFQIPEGLTPGAAEVRVNANGIISLGEIKIEAVAPGVFSVDSSGSGLAAAGMQCVYADGKQTYSPIVEFKDQALTAVAIDLNSASEVYLVLYGTGVRFRSEINKVQVRIGTKYLPVAYAGAHSEYVGLDQMNVLLPKSLVGAGNTDVELIVDGKIANRVMVKIK